MSTFFDYSLALFTNNEVIRLTGSVIESDSLIGNEIKKSLLTLHYDSNRVVNPFEIFDFTMKNKSKLKLTAFDSNDNIILYNVDGLLPTKGNKPGSFAISPRQYSEVPLSYYLTAERKEGFLIDAEENKEILDKKIDSINVDGLPGYESVWTTKNKTTNKISREYSTIIFDQTNDSFFYFRAMLLDNFDEYISDIKKTVRTFARK